MIITRQKRRILFLCSLLLMLLVNTFAFAPQISNDLVSNSISSDEKELPTDKEFDNLLSADYSSTYSGTGKNINVSLQQSILNTTDIQFSNLDTSNTFTEPCPTVSGFNSSFINISIDGISAPNKTLIVEDSDVSYQNLYQPYFTSFQVIGDGYLENVSVKVHTDSADTIYFDLYDSIYDSGSGYAKYDTLLTSTSQRTVADNNNIAHWISIYNWHRPLNTSSLNTYNKIFFIRIFCQSFTEGNWHNGNHDDGDETISWRGNTHLANIDFDLKVDLSPKSNIPKPSEINLKINNTAVSDISNQEGYWLNISAYQHSSGKLTFQLSADWWVVSCNVNSLQINYTKRDLLATSEFMILGSGQDILWNVTRNGGLNYFDSRLTNYTINFTIPLTWNDVEVWNGNVNKTENISTRALGNGYKDVKVFPANNGTFWFLNATSDNLLSSIDIYKGISPITSANFSDVVHFNATFSTRINSALGNDQKVNLSIYNPITSGMNYTYKNNLFNGDEINLGDWDVSTTVLEYGVFRVQVFWNNDTSAGFRESNITIYGDTDTIISKPKTTFDVDETFNITVLFNDTGRDLRINEATLSYSIEGNTSRTDNIIPIGNGQYNITIECDDDQFNDYGQKSIVINTTKQFYNNQTDTVNIVILALTDFDVLFSGGKSSFASNEVFNITVQYNDTNKNKGISDANINYTLDGSTWRYDNIKYIEEGKYNITVYCNDTNFDEYGSFDIIINASKQNYHNQSNILNPIVISITGVNVLTVENPSDGSQYYSTQIFNITVYFEDFSRVQGIENAIITVDIIGEGIYSSTPQSIGNGRYNITIDCSDTIFENYGQFIIRVNASKIHYQNDTVNLNVRIIGYTSLTVLSPSQLSYFGPTGLFNITVYYNDTIKDEGIIGALIEYQIEGKGYRFDDTYDLGGGYYNITIDVADLQFTIYGLQTIPIRANLTSYYNASTIYQFNRETNTVITTGNNTNLGSWYRGDTKFFIFNYSQQGPPLIPIVGATWKIISNLGNFNWTITDNGNGNYILKLNSTFVQANIWTFIFNISATGNATKIITLTITILLPRTEIQFPTTNLVDGVVPLGYNLTLNFNFTDIYKGIPIDKIETENVSITFQGINWSQFVIDFAHYANGGWELIHNVEGNYTLIISTYGLTQGNLYSITIRIDYTSPNPGPYNYSQIVIGFYYGSKTVSDGGDGGGGGGGGGGTTVMGISPETLMVYIILFTVGAIVVSGSVAAYKKVVVPKKREKERILREVTTIFDDAINLEHILVIHKGTGTCIYFKSFGIEKIDPQLISGFLTAVSSFGREMDSQESLNEITYGDKMLLLADGEYVRITLVLEKAASILLRQHLKKFIEAFEKKFANQLPKWRGQIDVFKDTGDIIDDVLNTSIILPHEINYDLAKVKTLENPNSRSVLKISNSLIEESDRKFFFISTLLIEATDKTGKDKAEIFMGIKELRDTKIISPIQISKIEEQPVSKQELDLINRRLCELPGITDEERQKLLADLSKMNPAEREAFLVSCQERKEIVSAPIKSMAGTTVIENIKSAKKEVRSLVKQAQTEIKKKNIDKGIEFYQNAVLIASNWDLTKDVGQIQDTIRLIRIENLKEKMRILESEGRKAAKGEEYTVAADKYKKASEAASEIFKLGITEMTKEVKRLTNKAKEYGKLS